MDKGFILLSRSILDSDVFASPNILKVWMWCLCKANFKTKALTIKCGKGESVKRVERGSFIFGRNIAAEELLMSASSVRNYIFKLQEMDMIKIESDNQYSVVTICNYDTYQDPKEYQRTTIGQRLNNHRTRNGQRKDREWTSIGHN